MDCGWSETRVLPVFDSMPLLNCYETAPIGGATLLHHAAELLSEFESSKFSNSRGSQASVTPIVAENFIFRYCSAAPSVESMEGGEVAVPCPRDTDRTAVINVGLGRVVK